MKKLFANFNRLYIRNALKKIFSIALLIVFLFNVGGYYVLFWGLRYQAKEELIQHLDANYHSTDGTITIKVPISIPYQMDWKAYERVDGDFEHNGEFYKLVKQKLERDTLYVVCIKNQKEKQLMSAMTDFIKLANDLPSTSSTLKLIGGFQKEFSSFTMTNLFSENEGWCSRTSYAPSLSLLIDRDTSIAAPPPKS